MSRPIALALGAGGVAVAVACVLSFDPAGIMAGLASVGWSGAAGLAVYRMLPICLCALAWFSLQPSGTVSFGACLAARLARDGVANVIAVVPAGGEVVGARMLTLAGQAPGMAAAAAIADVTVETASQVVFSLLGAMALVAIVPGAESGRWALTAVLISLPAVAGLAAVQHPKVMGWLQRMASRAAAGSTWAAWLEGDALSEALGVIYRARPRMAAGFALHVLAWLTGTGEAWLALRLIGHSLPILAVVALEAAVFAVRGAAFAVPWAAGVQEGSYLALGVALGLPPEVALSLSLVKRVPDLLTGLPGLALWRWSERKRSHALSKG
jgi:putative membrane protein